MRVENLRLGWLIAGLLPLAAQAGEDSIDRKIAASATGEVVISNVAGSIEVRGWDRNEVQVTGTLDDDAERLDLESSGGRVLVKVVLPRGKSHGGGADLEVLVPKMSSVEVSAVSADVSSRGVLGVQRLKTLSGEITADITGDNSTVSSVSGDLTIRGGGKPAALRISSVSGSVDLTNAAGRLELVTVSGDARVRMGEASDVRARTTSGTFDLAARLSNNGRIEVDAVSGDLTLRLEPRGSFSAEVESFSGDIHGCLAAKVEPISKYGPGTRLTIRTPEAGAHVRAKTFSGDIDICDER
jgi:DUF4097 and DUF4098 domain-containing protein YvlB